MNELPQKPTIAPLEEAVSEAASEADSVLTQALMDFAELQEDGLLGNREEFLARYPTIRAELDFCLNNLDQLRRIADVLTDSDRTRLMAQKALEPQQVIGEYEIVRLVGQGGMGIVYEARQSSLGRRLALKVLHACAAMDPRALARFHNEIQAAVLLDHPHIVNVLDVGNHDGIHFYTMRFIDGQSLADLKESVEMLYEQGRLEHALTVEGLARLSQCPIGQLTSKTPCDCQPISSRYYRAIAQLGVQAADALHYAHQQGIVHRDIKPSNLMLDERGNLWITDFGLARIENSMSLTQTGDLLGTLRFMSPEQINSDRGLIDHRSDIYSLGATLYELTTLEPLVPGTHREALLHAVLNGSPIAPTSLQAKYPRDLETILLKATAKDPADRYATCQDFGDDLQRYLEHRPIQAKRPTIGLRLWRWTQRNPKMARLCTVCSAMAMVGILVATAWINHMRNLSNVQRSENAIQRALTEAAESHLELHAKVSQSIMAFHAWKHHNYPLLKQIVASWSDRPEELAFVRKLLTQIANYRPAIVGQLDGVAYCIRLSHDESKLLCGGSDGVHILDRVSGRVLAHFQESQADVNGVAWSEDDQLVASAGDDGALNIYQHRSSETGDWTWSLVKSMKVDGPLVQPEFLANSQKVVACERKPMAIGPAPKNALHLWDMADDSEHEVLTGPSGDTEGISVSDDGCLVAVACRDQSVYVWDLRSRKLMHRIAIASNGPEVVQVSCVAFANDSHLLAVCTRSGTAHVVDADTGTVLQLLDSISAAIESIAVSPRAERICFGTRDGYSRVFEKSSASKWLPVAEYIHSQSLWSQVFASDGSYYACGAEGLIELVDCSQPMERARIKVGQSDTSSGVDSTILDMQIASDGNSLAFVSQARQLVVCEIPTGRVRCSQLLEGQAGAALAYSTDGRYLAIRTQSNQIELRSAADLRLISGPVVLPGGGWCSLTFGQNDSLLLAPRAYSNDPNTPDESIVGLNVPTLIVDNQRVPERLRGNLRLAAFSPPALAAVVDGFASPIEDRNRKADLASILNASPSKASIASGSNQLVCLCSDNTIRILHLNRQEQPLIIHSGSEACTDLAVTSDGTFIAVATKDSSGVGVVRVFHAPTGREIYSLPHYLATVSRVSFTPDGSQLIVAGGSIRNQAELVIWGSASDCR